MDGKILYEVVISVDPAIRKDYLTWLKQHISEMKALDGFVSAQLFINTENENELTCHYRLKNHEAMRAYLDGPAKKMRADGINRFSDKFSAQRRILSFDHTN